ncbi:hypothetical protein Cni_G27595 [Canna indica]|uniref:RRM domain-containing protein n=1 Tax=Canna indica TaxID=4628 RepID=A0AAQ3L129_9LILI|nr:hypothetical protein Cni_G27595 [Canna indica]
MDVLFLPASFFPTSLASKPSLLFPPRASHKPPPEAAVRRPLNPAIVRQPPPDAPIPSIPVGPPPAPPDPLKHPAANPLAPRLWLSSKLSPPPPPPPPTLVEVPGVESNVEEPPSPADNTVSTANAAEFRVKGKIFVGNLPRWAKKNQINEFFGQFGPLEKVELIRDHDDPERNMGYCFLLYGGPTAEESAAKAVEFDGVEFHGRILTVRLDDGSQLRARKEEKARWLAGSNGREYRSKWHEERGNASIRFMKVLDTKPEDWQAVMSAFEKIPKNLRSEDIRPEDIPNSG